MKRFFHVIFCLLITIISLSAAAQYGEQKEYFKEDLEQRFYGGIVLGMNLSQVDGDTYGGYHKVGLVTGGKVYWRINQPLSLSVGLLYSQKGARAVVNMNNPYAGPGFGKYKIGLSYIELPILLNCNFQKIYQIGIGLSYNGLLTASEFKTPDYNGSLIQPDQINFNKSTIDGILSASVMFSRNMILNGRYQYGLTPLRYSGNLNGVGYGDQYNNMFSFRLIYLF